MLPRSLGVNEELAAAVGDWNGVRSFAGPGLEIDPEDFRLLGPLVTTEFELGNFEEGGRYLETLRDVAERLGPGPTSEKSQYAARAGMASYVSGDRSRLSEVARMARAVIEAPTVSPLRASNAAVGLAFVAVIENDLETARDAKRLLEKSTEYWWGVAISRVVGLLDRVLGNSAEVASHFENALTFLRRAGYRPQLAWTCHDYAEMFAGSSSPVEREKSVRLDDEALQIARELGMKPLTERILRQRQFLKA